MKILCLFSLDIFASLEQILNFGMVLRNLIPDPVFTAQVEEFLSCLTNIVQYVEEENDERVRSMVRMMGRPRLVIEEDHIRFFVDHGFKVQDMALMLGCSKQTVERRLHMYNLSTQRYSHLRLPIR